MPAAPLDAAAPAGPARLVGLDVGHKRVGLALADPLRLFARPHGTFAPAEALDALDAIRRAEGIEALVVGWPLLPDGSEGTATELVGRFIARLEKRLPGVPVVRQDERHTSEVAKEAIRAAGPRASRGGRAAKRARVDAAAAAVILQDYLDGR